MIGTSKNMEVLPAVPKFDVEVPQGRYNQSVYTELFWEFYKSGHASMEIDCGTVKEATRAQHILCMLVSRKKIYDALVSRRKNMLYVRRNELTQKVKNVNTFNKKELYLQNGTEAADGEGKTEADGNNPADSVGKAEYPILRVQTGNDADGGACQGSGGAAGDHRQAEGEGAARIAGEGKNINFSSLYARNSDFKAYVDKYCVKHRCTVEDALQHYLVRMVGRQYWEMENQI